MKITRVTIAQRELTLSNPVFTARGIISTRNVILLAIHTAEGPVGIGEAAPLPDHGTETFDAAWFAARRIADLSDFPPLPLRARDLSPWLTAVDLHYPGHPALYFAVQSALIALLCTHYNVEAVSLFPRSSERGRSVPVNALLAGSTDNSILDAAGCAVEAGFRVLKVKVGHRALNDDINLVQRVCRTFPNVQLRIDANCAWPLGDAERFCYAVDSPQIEYIEDPLDRIEEQTLVRLRKSTRIPFALDEPVRQIPLIVPLLRDRLFEVLILKPTVIGAYDVTIDLAGEALHRNIDVVITSALESGVGLTYLANLAAGIGSHRRQGLGTGSLLSEDTITAPLNPERGRIPVPDVRSLPSLLTEDLQRDLLITERLS